MIPSPVPVIPRVPLWTALAVPPVLTFVSNMLVGLLKIGKDDGLSLLIPPVMFFVIIGFSVKFHLLMKNRYRGRSLVFLNLGYFLGQIIVCLALWFGSCALFFNTSIH